ncbi:hypothetical protein DH2020_009343 [Rehmannia glutinosa]|uniref:Ribosomal protein L34Ae n=1 Tax=Rehmannia glutinosa TaxID=99300 RepID=A0ABR0X979_REHGL
MSTRIVDGSGSKNTNDEKINFLEPEAEQKKDVTERDFDGHAMEEDKSEVYLKFKFPTFEEFSKTQKGTGNNNNNILNHEVVPFACSSKYESTSGKSFISAFIDELETLPVKEINASDGNGNFSENEEGFSGRNLDEDFYQTGGVHDKDGNFSENEEGFSGRNLDEDFYQTGGVHDKDGNFSENEEGFSDRNLDEDFYQTGGVHDKRTEILVFDGEENVKSETMEFIENSGEKAEIFLGNECHSLSEKSSVITDSDSESTSFERIHPVMNRLADGFLSDGDFGGEFDNEKMETDSELSNSEEKQDSSDDFDDKESDTMDELNKLEEHDLKNRHSDFLSDKDFIEKSKDSSEDANDLESLWEHQELVEQLKIELRKVRATGLPTIFEESESPKLMDDLKPWKIDEFKRDDCKGELHRFYKSYREKMRKFDIINYQKMYAMGFLQLKDPLQSISKQKPSPPTLKSLVSQNLWLFKHKIHGSDPMKKFIQELQGDLEAVYVGQMCLSWEFLHWQYDKALDLWDSDPRGIRRYNEVAGEFQQFQVLMQRFIEDEPFQGPRVQNYVKSRCAVRNLLQVPVIREDNMKDKRKARTKLDTNDYVITSDMLVEIVEESIRIFWRFVRADKDCTTATINGHKKMPELHNHDDIKLLVEVKKILQKKERKLKDLLRSENCILKKFRQCREDDSDQIPHLRPAEYKRSRLPRNCRTVNRPYGGVLSGSAVRERIIRAFLVEEQKIVKKVLKIQKAKEKQASKS